MKYVSEKRLREIFESNKTLPETDYIRGVQRCLATLTTLECKELDPWLPFEDAPRDRKIIAYNPFIGQYITRYTNGQWPCFGALELGGVKISTEYGASIHFPKPTHYKELSEDPKTT